jgi:hypothetical protein
MAVWPLPISDQHLTIGIHAKIIVAGEAVQRVASYKYLGCLLNEKWDYSQEVKTRIEQARSAFVKMRNLLSKRELSLNTRTRIVRCYVLPVLLYGHEGWTLTKVLEKRLAAFEMWIYRRMLRIPWTA